MAIINRPGNRNNFKFEKPFFNAEMRLAHQYCQGKGIELGAAAHNPFGLSGAINVAPITDDANKPDYIEFQFYKKSQEEICGYYALVDLPGEAHAIPVEDSSQDYIISSHVVEHLPDTISAFLEWNRVLKAGGIIFMIFPKRNALVADQCRAITPLREFIEDYHQKITAKDHPFPPGQGKRGHYHVFTLTSMLELIDWCNKNLNLSWQILVTEQTDSKVGNGHTVVARYNPITTKKDNLSINSKIAKNAMLNSKMDDTLAWITRQIPKNSHVLGIGIADKYFTNFLIERYQCKVDLFEQQHFDNDLEKRAEQLPASIYDVILCVNFPGCWSDPITVLKHLKSLLNTNGKMIISATNIGHAGMVAKLLAGEFSYQEDIYRRLITRKILVELCYDADLYVELLDVISPPIEYTEFNSSFEKLSPMLKTLLLSGQDALVYQFVLIATPDTNKKDSKAIEAILDKDPLFNRLDLAYLALNKMQIDNVALLDQIEQLRRLNNQLQNSISWRITAPLRKLYDWLSILRRSLQKNSVANSDNKISIAKKISDSHTLLNQPFNEQHQYQRWIAAYDQLSDSDCIAINHHIERLNYKPLISIVMITCNTEEKFLRLAIDSVLNQLYYHWELCIADDASTSPKIKMILTEYQQKDSRIKLIFQTEESNSSVNFNSALMLANGEFIALLDQHDEISQHALYMVALELNINADAALIYSDEDCLNATGERCQPYFKPDWNPDLFLTQNYINNLTIYRTHIVRELGGLRLGYEGNQHWALAMRMIEKIPHSHIYHIPFILYHCRTISNSQDIYHNEQEQINYSGWLVLASHFERMGIEAQILFTFNKALRIKYLLPQPPPLVSLIIVIDGSFNQINRCIESLLQKTSYEKFELILVNNRSDNRQILDYLDQLKAKENVKVLNYTGPAHYSLMHNYAVKYADGDVVGLINSNIEVISPEWLSEMVSNALRPEIGAVGAKICYLDNSIHHAGIVLGNNNIGYIFKHHAGNKIENIYRTSRTQNFTAITLDCLIIRKKIFEEVGGLNEKELPTAYHAVDLCIRIQELGYRNLYTPYAELYYYQTDSNRGEKDPAKEHLIAIESGEWRDRWQKWLLKDPAYNVNLSMDRLDYSLSSPPRIKKPWLG